MFNAEQFCIDNDIVISKLGKHVRFGWVNISCPFCLGQTGYHGGFNVDKGYYNCYRCGHHPLTTVIMKLTSKDLRTSLNVIKNYSSVSIIPTKKKVQQSMSFPSDIKNLTTRAKKYLINRNFDPKRLASIWGLLSTGYIGFYKHRIFAPIYQKQTLVSYQCRDITDQHPQKYLACKQEEEIIPHQNCLYGFDQVINYKSVVVVEGITDVWRLGQGAVATFGTGFTKQQAKILATNFYNIYILFDNEPEAQEKAKQLGFLINSAFKNSVKVTNLCLSGKNLDPGNMNQSDADQLMKEIL